YPARYQLYRLSCSVSLRENESVNPTKKEAKAFPVPATPGNPVPVGDRLNWPEGWVNVFSILRLSRISAPNFKMWLPFTHVQEFPIKCCRMGNCLRSPTPKPAYPAALIIGKLPLGTPFKPI